MTTPLKSILLVLIASFIGSFGAVFLKAGAGRLHRELDWRPDYTFENGLSETIDWYLNNQAWLASIAESRYRGERLGLLSRSK